MHTSFAALPFLLYQAPALYVLWVLAMEAAIVAVVVVAWLILTVPLQLLIILVTLKGLDLGSTALATPATVVPITHTGTPRTPIMKE